jgi:CHAD domain-containing protein
MATNIAQTGTRPDARPAKTRPERPAARPAAPHPERPAQTRQVSLAPHDVAARRQQAFMAGTRPQPSSSAGDVVLAYLRFQSGVMHSLEPLVRADEPDAVHQMRVATRRLRATLRTFGMVIPRPRSEKVAADLKWLGGLLGAARDGEVLPAHLQASLRPTPPELLIGPVLARVQGHFAPARAAARTELLEALDSPRYASLLGDLDQLSHEPPLGPQAGAPARDVLPAAVRRAYRQAHKRMRRARHTPEGQPKDVALHQARKSARRARYAAEAARPAIGKQARRFSRQMKKVQSVLGEHQDSVVARQAARDLGIGAHLAGENAFTYGLLHEREAHQASHLQAQSRHIWKHASRPRYRHWMH